MSQPTRGHLAVEARGIDGSEPHRCAVCGKTEDLGLIRGGPFQSGVVCCFEDGIDLAAVLAAMALEEMERATGEEYALGLS